MHRLTMTVVMALVLGFGIGEASAKAGASKSAKKFSCFSEDVKRELLPGKSIPEAINSIQKGIPLKIRLNDAQLCNKDLQKALLARKGPIDIQFGEEELSEMAFWTCLEPLKTRLCGLALSRASDAGLVHVSGLKNLEALDLSYSAVSNAGLAQLSGLKNLVQLNLGDTSISNGGLPHLRGLKNLVLLDLQNTTIEDDGLEHLKGLKNLEYLNLRFSYVSETGASKLKALLPRCDISYGQPGCTEEGDEIGL